MNDTNTSVHNPTASSREQDDAISRQPADESVESWALFGTARQLLIRHDNETYRLQITRSNKLILTK